MALGLKIKGLLDCRSGISHSVIASISQVNESKYLYTKMREEFNRTISGHVPNSEKITHQVRDNSCES